MGWVGLLSGGQGQQTLVHVLRQWCMRKLGGIKIEELLAKPLLLRISRCCTKAVRCVTQQKHTNQIVKDAVKHVVYEAVLHPAAADYILLFFIHTKHSGFCKKKWKCNKSLAVLLRLWLFVINFRLWYVHSFCSNSRKTKLAYGG